MSTIPNQCHTTQALQHFYISILSKFHNINNNQSNTNQIV
ncbi:hypothetical protein ECHHL_0320 [Ehrlichia chaffeensis str. Heartland]|nr:hypothetical protein ECHHL_0320 [Ehrlichia chaffeensis str. Heartland]AHX05795.1 hypothetical protein ECHJAX_0738 [Ehrlichia chaffeensis str. Jax]AHX06786.1 hypothetical protein ECHLIB_0741 [Ehrlichia chaffeensis str. Liberty]AHX09500.1 hypothetical protein ECHWAK_0735 [Ehrlichia chaffeensis str. Wakulla]AHX10556.1 hypothetical protein ECHWP_0316 [Ehrlichia chaffeensis str. West Paces]